MIARALRALPGLLVIVIVAAGAHAASPDAGRVALVIGNGAYEAQSWALSEPEHDAMFIGEALRAAGYDVDVRVDADRDEMDEALAEFTARLSAGDGATSAFFYFSGHAAAVNGVNYLLPVDAAPLAVEEIDVQATALAHVRQAMKRPISAADFVVLDAARAHPVAEESETLAGGGLAPVGVSLGVLIAFAAQPGASVEQSSDAASAGAYARALSGALGAPGLPAEAAFAQAAHEVEALTDFRQSPWMRSGLDVVDFYFSAAPTAEDFQTRVRELLRWDAARSSGDSDSFAGYLVEYPDGRFAGEARARLARLAMATAPREAAALADVAADEDAAEAIGATRSFVGDLAASSAPIEASEPAWRAVDPEHLLVMDTNRGRILIETYPDLAPLNAVRVRELAREGFYDGTPFYRVVEGFAALGGDPAGAANHATGEAIARDRIEAISIDVFSVSVADPDRGRVGVYAEDAVSFGLWDGAPVGRRSIAGGGEDVWITHCPGVVSSVRDDDPAAADTEFAIMRGEAPGLDLTRTPWGRVVDGLDVVYDLAVGNAQTPGFTPDRMTRVRVAADLPGRARPHVDVLNEAGPEFEGFFAGLRADLGREPRVCEVRLPVRVTLGLADVQ